MKRVLFVAVLAIAVAGVASAEVGTFSATSSTSESGWTINIDIEMETTGATSPQPNDWFGAGGQIYYPYTWNTLDPNFTSVFSFEQSGRQTNGGYPFSRTVRFSQTAPVMLAGDWGVWTTCRAASAGAGTWTTRIDSYVVDGRHLLPAPTYTPDPNAGGNPVPTLNGWGIIAMIMLVLGFAVVMISRRS